MYICTGKLMVLRFAQNLCIANICTFLFSYKGRHTFNDQIIKHWNWLWQARWFSFKRFSLSKNHHDYKNDYVRQESLFQHNKSRPRINFWCYILKYNWKSRKNYFLSSVKSINVMYILENVHSTQPQISEVRKNGLCNPLYGLCIKMPNRCTVTIDIKVYTYVANNKHLLWIWKYPSIILWN